jgi:pimeloyl-ACP methyl ester carboxylesterase
VNCFTRHIATVLVILGAVGLLAPLARAAAPSPRSPAALNCSRLARLSNRHLAISTARWESAGVLPGSLTRTMPMLASVELPANCLVRGVLNPRVGVDRAKYGLGFELRMPVNWNGRFLFQGGAGLDGFVAPAVGLIQPGSQVALVRGFAVISSDGGHEGMSARFAADQQARLDYAYAGLGPTAELGKRLIERYYGRPARDSYFAGCSNGGREAMMVAQRFPTLFNGIVAGDPGFNLSRAAIAEMWNVKHLESVAPKDPSGRPILSEALSPADLQLLSRAVLKACDALDGLRDGMINNLTACQKVFNPRVLLCRRGAPGPCLSAAKVKVLEAIFGGPRDAAGRPLYASWPYDAGVSAPGWRIWKLGTSRTGIPNALDATLGLEAMRSYFMTPPDSRMTPQTFDFNRALHVTRQTRAINDATGTFFSSFIAHGGKLLIYQGLSDPVFSPNAIIGWYRQLMRQYGRPQHFARLFLVPGMNHCFGGPATDEFDPLTAIVHWSEDQKPPARMIAHGRAFPGETRPLCPYPEYARYLSGNPKSAKSFACYKRS